jgi:hypothetical protein
LHDMSLRLLSLGQLGGIKTLRQEKHARRRNGPCRGIPSKCCNSLRSGAHNGLHGDNVGVLNM